MRLVIDASVAVKLAIKETGHAKAIALVSAGYHLVAPDFLLLELGNVLWKKVRLREITPEQARAGAAEVRIALAEIVPAVELVDRALELAMEIDHPIYDCLYLAVAEAGQARLITADRRLLSKLAVGSHADLAIDLAQGIQS